MEEMGFWRWRGSLRGWLAAAVRLLFLLSACSAVATVREVRGNAYPGVQLQVQNNQVVMDNGIVEVTFSNPDGEVTGIKFNGIDNLLEPRNRETNRGYWDIVWNRPGEPSLFTRIEGTTFKVVANTDDVVEVSFVSRWSNSSELYLAPLIVDKRFVVRRGSSGFYGYAIFEHPKGWPDLDVGEARIAFKLNGQKFHYMAISDERQRVMPTAEDRASGRVLDYKEAVLLTNPSNSELEGEVDDKYQYSCENQENKVHGWISSDPPVGFWMITPSHESHSAGPVKQDLTSHVGPTTLNVFYSNHYAGKDVHMSFRNGEAWKKVYGPFMVYFNSVSPEEDQSKLWVDAKGQMLMETESWPYDFIYSNDYPSSAERGTVGGQMTVRDRYMKNSDMVAESAYVGLAAPGEVGSWQKDTKGYQFWTRADENGSFEIRNVRPGIYGLYAWVPGFIGDYRYHLNITVKPGSEIQLGALVFSPPRSGPTLWEIGIPDRTAAEFYVPLPNPRLMNKVFKNDTEERFRHYGLWKRYTELYPENDLVYTVGVDDYRIDWFFAHVTRNIGNSTYVPTTWRIDFNLQNVDFRGTYRLQMAVASATQSHISIRVNDPSGQPLSSTGRFGYDNAIARHGIHGLYWTFSFDVPGSRLRRRANSIYLAQSSLARTPFEGVMVTGEKDVTFKVLYCGICHFDLHNVNNEWGFMSYPVVPGHEIVGVITEVRTKVTKFRVEDRVASGIWLDHVTTARIVVITMKITTQKWFQSVAVSLAMIMTSKYSDGTIIYGGFSDIMVADEHFVFKFPNNMPLDGGAPLLCAGITVYSPLRYCGLDKPRMHLGGVGLRGLGHMAVKFAKAMGLKATVISTSPSKKEEAMNHLGADAFFVSHDAEQMQLAMGIMNEIIDTISVAYALLRLIGLLKIHGKLVMVGVPDKPIQLLAMPLLMGRKIVGGSIIGGIKETQEMIDFAAKHNITADIEVIPMNYVNIAMEGLAKADVRYQFVINIGNSSKSC